jgi:hypothetical protein
LRASRTRDESTTSVSRPPRRIHLAVRSKQESKSGGVVMEVASDELRVLITRYSSTIVEVSILILSRSLAASSYFSVRDAFFEAAIEHFQAVVAPRAQMQQTAMAFFRSARRFAGVLRSALHAFHHLRS